MPMYEYHCSTCDQTIEVIQRHGLPDPDRCGADCAQDFGPEMGRGEVARVEFSLTGGHVLGVSRPPSKGPAGPDCGVCGRDTKE